MPHLRFRAVNSEHIQELSELLCKDLAREMATDEENFTFEEVSTQFYSRGKKVEGYPFVEVLLFERPLEVQDRCARLITDRVKALGAAGGGAGYADVAVIFVPLSKRGYYENGNCF